MPFSHGQAAEPHVSQGQRHTPSTYFPPPPTTSLLLPKWYWGPELPGLMEHSGERGPEPEETKT